MYSLVKGFQNLVAGEDNELTAAYAHFRKMVEQGKSAIGMAILAGVEQLKQEGSATHADVKEGLVMGGHIEQKLESETSF